MKVLVLNPFYGEDFCRSARWAAKSRGRVQRHPDWLLTAVAVLERGGHQVVFTDAAALNLDMKKVAAIAADFRPELAVVHTTTPSIYSDIDHARMLKETCGCRTVLVGPHVTALPAETLALAGGAADYVARGEYDYVLLDLAYGKDPASIAGLSYLKDGKAVNNPYGAPVDVNSLPFPAWRHIDPELYKDVAKRVPFLTIISGRGCLGRCTFCRDTTESMHGRHMRLRSARAIVDEMEYDLKLFPRLRELMFETDTLTGSAVHLKALCEEILKRGLKVTWSCNTRVDMDLSLLPLMKKAGCRMLMVGFEFGTQAALDAVKKGITLEQSRSFAAEASRLGFTLHGCFMVGAPGETRESAEATIEFAKSLPLDTVQFSGICVYPGTELYDWAREKGYLVPKDWREWVSPNCEQVTLLSYPQLSKEEIDYFIDRGLKEFYLRPLQILRMLFTSPSDLMRKLYGARSFFSYLLGRKKA
ncbi:MAG: B12-binding domain-containing radical SAM protein [Elusimicrobiales bacterium]|nr:B12-binding domain-containing radical SAM protein [Elusimicrobiales bacterium]